LSIIPIYLYGTDVLRKKAKPVHKVTDDIVRLVMDMFETMRKAHGIGLAATQVGNMHRVIVVDVSDMEETKDVKPISLINPEVILRDGKITMEEGCLSIPEVRDYIERDEQITVRYKDTNFKPVELHADGLLARVILHEIDHLNGVLFLDYLSPAQRKVHKEALQQMERGEVEVAYPVVTGTPVTV